MLSVYIPQNLISFVMCLITVAHTFDLCYVLEVLREFQRPVA
jgi:hypothetical protein